MNVVMLTVGDGSPVVPLAVRWRGRLVLGARQREYLCAALVTRRAAVHAAHTRLEPHLNWNTSPRFIPETR